jgi:hypothetical protein
MNTREKLKLIKTENEKFSQFAFKNPEVADKIRKYGREARKYFTAKEAMTFNEFLFKSYKKYHAFCASQNVVKNFDNFSNSDNPFKGPVFEFMDEKLSLYSLFQDWNQNKIVYNYTAEMASNLIDNAGDLEERSIPVDALKHLPYRMFFLGLDVASKNDEFIGFFVRTDDDKAVISLVMDTLDPESKSSHDLSETFVTLYFKENITVNDLYREIEDSSSEKRQSSEDVYHKLGVNIDDRRKEHIQEECEIHRGNSTIIVKMLPLFLYLATEKPDIKEFANPADKKKPDSKEKKINKPAEKITKYSVGEEFTIKYRKFQKTCAEYERIKGESAEVALRKMPPHTRKAHWHHHWVGSDLNPEKNGPRRLRLDWQEATFVHLELKDLLCPTVIEIEKDEEESVQQTQQTEELDDYEYDR